MDTRTPANVTLDDWHPLPEFVERHKTKLTTHSIRYYLRNRDTNGLAPAVRRFGKRLFISDSRFAEWFAQGAGA